MSDAKAARKNLKQHIKKCHAGSCPGKDISDEEKSASSTWSDEDNKSLPSTGDVHAYRSPTKNNENYTDDSDSSSTFTTDNQSYDSSASYSDSNYDASTSPECHPFSNFSSHNSYDSTSTSSCTNSSCSTCDPACSSEDWTSVMDNQSHDSSTSSNDSSTSYKDSGIGDNESNYPFTGSSSIASDSISSKHSYDTAYKFSCTDSSCSECDRTYTCNNCGNMFTLISSGHDESSDNSE